MAANTKQSESFQQIKEAFEAAQAQLAQLRKQVEQHAELARVKAHADLLQQQREKALRELGEAVWRQVQKGKLELPASLAQALKAVQQMEQKVEAHSREISDLLREGEETAKRLKQKNEGGTHSGVASRGKKL